MSVTVFLDEPLEGDEKRVECEEVKIVGDIVWVTPADGDRETIIPISNITGAKGDDVEQVVEDVEAPGGRYIELITNLS